MAFFNAYIASTKSEFSKTKNLGLKAIQCLSEKELNQDVNESNSIAIIVKHLRGNMKSRWTNLFSEDGEKPDRNRDEEFLSASLSKTEIENMYLEGWAYLEKALADIKEADFEKPVLIRNLHKALIHYFTQKPPFSPTVPRCTPRNIVARIIAVSSYLETTTFTPRRYF